MVRLKLSITRFTKINRMKKQLTGDEILSRMFGLVK